MDYSALWTVADSMRVGAMHLEQFIRCNEGELAEVDTPRGEQSMWSAAAEAFNSHKDRVELYRHIELTLRQARHVLMETAALTGSRVTSDHTRECRDSALRCRKALAELLKAGEL